MAITAAMVKELREISGAGMMDCKKALTATEGDMDKAMEFLREKGLATAQKKASRIAAQVGMLLCCFVAVMEVAVTGQVSMESWLIYFGILSTLFLIKYRLMKKRHELFLSIFYTALFLMFLVLFLWKLLC